MAARDRVQPDPARSQHPQHVAVREQRHIPFDVSHPRDDAIDPFGDLLWALALGAAISGTPSSLAARSESAGW